MEDKNRRVIYESVKSNNPLNVSAIAGYITNCQKCNAWIFIRFRVPSVCIDCQASALHVESKDIRKLYRRAQWKRARRLTFEAKGKLCVYCTQPATHIDHRTPISRGGTNRLDNLQPACAPCNIQKFKKTHEEYLELIKRKGVGFMGRKKKGGRGC